MFRTLIAAATFGSRSGRGRNALGTWLGFGGGGARVVAWWTARWGVARRAKLVRPEFAVAVAVEFAERVCRVVEFLRVDHAIMIRIERAEKPARRARCGVGTWATFAARGAVTLRCVGRAWCGGVLGAEGPRRQRKRYGGGE
jgi:hypothetical protein